MTYFIYKLLLNEYMYLDIMCKYNSVFFYTSINVFIQYIIDYRFRLLYYYAQYAAPILLKKHSFLKILI